MTDKFDLIKVKTLSKFTVIQRHDIIYHLKAKGRRIVRSQPINLHCKFEACLICRARCFFQKEMDKVKRNNLKNMNQRIK